MLNRFPSTIVSAIASVIVPVLAVTLLVGCGGSPDPVADTAPGVDPDDIDAVRIVEHLQGEDEALAEPRIALIRTAEALEALGTDLALSPGDLDFETHSLIVFALGEQRTGGYWAKITGAQRVGDTLWVQGVANAPADDEAATQQLTYPYVAAIIERIDVARVREDIRSVTGQQPEAFAPAAAR